MARTPYWRPSGSVKRTIRALVVVPMQIFSYVPLPSASSETLRTFGAVCSRNAPPRSIGGSTHWSKMRVCVRSRMPMMSPCTVTSSPACSFRISCGSVIGNVTVWLAIPLGLAVVVDGAVGRDVRGGAPRRPALVVHGNRVESHVRVGVLDVALQDGDVAAEPHRADTRLVEEAEQLVLELRDDRVGVACADRSHDRVLRERHRIVGGAADPDPDDPGRARLTACAHDRLEHELLDPLHAVGRGAHLQEAHVLGARALRDALHVEPVPVLD